MRTRLPFFPQLRNFSSFKGTTVTRTPEKSVLNVDLSEQLKDFANKEHILSLKVHVYKVNGSVPPVQVINGDCSVELGKESKRLYALDTQYHEHHDMIVKVKSGTSFSLSFDKDVYVDEVYGISVIPTASENSVKLKV